MCFTKTPKVEIAKEPEKVIRHEANASLTKPSSKRDISTFANNLRTSPIGLSDSINTEKKTLLGE